MKELEQEQENPPSWLQSFLKRLRNITFKDQSESSFREAIEEILEEPDLIKGASKLTVEEREILLNALSFSELRVDDVMVPRADIAAVEQSSTLKEVITTILEEGHSRLLVYHGNLDEVIGAVHIKDLLPYWGDGANFKISDVLRKVLVVPPSMPVLSLLLEMRDSRSQIAAVVDEFGGTDGLVTIEDLVQEILGDIHDEHRADDEPVIEVVSEGIIRADARADLDDLEEKLGLPLLGEPERDEVDTLAGFIFTLIDRVPKTGEVFEQPEHGLSFTIEDADPRRIKLVLIKKLDQ